MTGIQIKVVDQDVNAALDRIDRVAADPSAIMAEIAGYLVTSSQRHIETESGPDGKWQRLSPRTAARRIGRRRRGTENMLRVTNRLYSSIIGESSTNEAMVGTNAIQAALLHFGGPVQMPAREQDIRLGKTNRGKRFVKASAKRGETRRVQVGAHSITIPARPFLYLSDEDTAEILRIAEDGFRREAGMEAP